MCHFCICLIWIATFVLLLLYFASLRIFYRSYPFVGFYFGLPDCLQQVPTRVTFLMIFRRAPFAKQQSVGWNTFISFSPFIFVFLGRLSFQSINYFTVYFRLVRILHQESNHRRLPHIILFCRYVIIYHSFFTCLNDYCPSSSSLFIIIMQTGH